MKPLLAVALAASAVAAQPQPSKLDPIFARLDSYLESYEAELSTVVADEDMRQQTSSVWGSQSIRLASEFAFLRLPGKREWLGFRNVQKVNDKTVSKADVTLMALLTAPSQDAFEQARLLADASARYNLGNPRTLNVPNLPLELLSREYRHRYEITLDGSARIRGRRTDILELLELGPPPIVYNGGRGLTTRIRAWIDRETGALWRAQIRLQDESPHTPSSRVEVEFAEERALRILVPVEMREEFNTELGRGKGTATYRNFRRFQTTARIVPQ